MCRGVDSLHCAIWGSGQMLNFEKLCGAHSEVGRGHQTFEARIFSLLHYFCLDDWNSWYKPYLKTLGFSRNRSITICLPCLTLKGLLLIGVGWGLRPCLVLTLALPYNQQLPLGTQRYPAKISGTVVPKAGVNTTYKQWTGIDPVTHSSIVLRCPRIQE